ncbi:hypothetical protein FTI75_28900 [Burkholderia pseudomallei]|nr:hypothetical protein D2V84_33725 [Burkholderia pseudomallei]RIV65747.1 hypothetical protein D2W72_22470 [Burkholderia pseudomallei]TXD01239.1 hypothetical protein FTI75_28900 [Burkholderia pseudomallei]
MCRLTPDGCHVTCSRNVGIRRAERSRAALSWRRSRRAARLASLLLLFGEEPDSGSFTWDSSRSSAVAQTSGSRTTSTARRWSPR